MAVANNVSPKRIATPFQFQHLEQSFAWPLKREQQNLIYLVCFAKS